MKRSITEFKDYLFRDNIISHGTIFCTGTAIGIPNNMFIEDGDLCHIELEKIGLIKNLAKKQKLTLKIYDTCINNWKKREHRFPK